MPPATEMQQMEIDMVEGMYTDHFEFLSADPPTFSVGFRATPEDEVELKLVITYPDEEYPDNGVPLLAAENVSKDRRIPTDKLLEELRGIAKENMGMHMVVLLLQHSQEFLSQLVEADQKSALARKGDQLAANSTTVAVADPTIRMGTALSREAFAEWAAKRTAEKRLARAELAKKQLKESASKLTGRQLWDSTLRNTDWELFGGGDADDAVVDLGDAGFEYVLDEEEEEGTQGWSEDDPQAAAATE